MSGNEYNAEAIRRELSRPLSERLDIVFYNETDSTNLRALEMAKRGVDVETAVVANCQTAGRGRLGKSFDSKEGAGIYLTLLIPGKKLPQDFIKITRYSAVKVARAIDGEAEIRTEIKWVNDIYYSKKKLAGILVQSLLDESGAPEYAIVGVGVNVEKRAFPDEIKDIAGALLEFSNREISRARLAARIIEELVSGLGNLASPDVVDEYKTRSCLLGRAVAVIENGAEFCAEAVNITDSGALVIRLPDGTQRELSSGNISLKIL